MFSLTIPLSLDGVKLIKSSLAIDFSEIKSSHRCEAAARGLGFKTYASMRAGIQDSVCIDATANGEAFVAYLKARGFSYADAPAFYVACARVAVHGAMQKEPMLTYYGIGAGDRERDASGRRETHDQYNEKVLELKRQLGGRWSAEEFLRSLAFLSKVHQAESFERGYSSYNIKHIAENDVLRYPTGEELGPDYVSNGALIAAAIHAGFKWRTHKSREGTYYLSADLNASTKSLRVLDRRIRG